MTGLQCPKQLWIQINKPELVREPTKDEEFRMKQGIIVGEFATKLFPEGIALKGLDKLHNNYKTFDLIRQKKIIFEGGAIEGECYARADILVPSENGYDIYEVKSSSKLKPEHIPDIAFQKYCFENAGIKINNCFLIHINPDYVKEGEIDVNKLFTILNVNDQVEVRFKDIEKEIEEILKFVKSKEMPDIKIGNHCHKPHDCPLIPFCFKHLPEGNVTELFYNKSIPFELLDKGITLLKDIPSDIKLKGRPKQQAIQVKVMKENKRHFDNVKIKEFIDGLSYPLIYFDFETYAPAIPLFDGMSSYQRYPFQFSAHIEHEDGTIEHKDFLATDKEDQREELINSMLEAFGDKGSIIVWYQSFEKSVLKELVEDFPEFEKQIMKNVIPRVVDLAKPFEQFDFYDPKQKGKYSIKVILPILTDLSYKELGIQNGGEAYTKYYEMVYGDLTDEERLEIKNNLLEYCKMDTWAEVEILKRLIK